MSNLLTPLAANLSAPHPFLSQAIVAGFNQAQAATLSGDVASYIQARDIIIRNIQVRSMIPKAVP